jgi:hypothetical protein
MQVSSLEARPPHRTRGNTYKECHPPPHASNGLARNDLTQCK